MTYRKRINAVLKNIRTAAHLVTSPADLFYLTGVSLEGFYLLFAKGKVCAFSPLMLKNQLKQFLGGIPVIPVKVLSDSLAEFLKKNRIRTLGVNPGDISHAFFKKLGSKMDLKTADPISSCREVKDAEEIRSIRKSCKIVAEILKNTKKAIKPGVSEIEIAFKIHEYFAKNLVKPAFPPIVAFGKNTANPHHEPSSRKAVENDIVTVDIGCVFEGYCSDLTRTFFLGKIPPSNLRAYIIIKEAQKAAIRYISAGKQIRDIDFVARDIIEKNGLGRNFIHSTGHGVGIQVHEAPRISRDSKGVLKPGMVVTVEPGVYLPNNFGVRIEDTVLVKENGFDILTK